MRNGHLELYRGECYPLLVPDGDDAGGMAGQERLNRPSCSNEIFKTRLLGLEELSVCLLLPLMTLAAVDGEKALARRGLLCQNTR